jgi:general secretion pathway protein H
VSSFPRQRGVTLIEILVTLAIIALMAGGAMLGLGAISSARLRESSTQVSGAIKLAYNHANATSRPTRLVFDFEQKTIAIEDSEGRMLVQSGDRTGGAAAATELEQALQKEAEGILQGPRAPRADFQPVERILGFEHDDGVSVKRLREGISFRLIEVAHDDDASVEGRAYLYFWPGGMTQNAAIHIQKDGSDDVITILVAPLTGKTRIVGGAVEMPRPRNDAEESEREDRG